MKFLIGIISGIVLAGTGAAVAAGPFNTTSAPTATPQISFTEQAVVPTKPLARRVQGLSGELSRKDTGAFELKLTVRQNGELVDRDVRILVAHATVTNRLGRIVRLPLDDATAHVTGVMLPRNAWRLDDDGQLTPTFAAKRVVVLTTTPAENTLETQAQDTQNQQDEQNSADVQDSNAD